MYFILPKISSSISDTYTMAEAEAAGLPSIEDELICPVCLMLPRSTPVPQCPAGHIVCEKCFAGLDPAVCPTCRAPMRNDVFSITGTKIS